MGNISISDVMATRGAILDRNAALRNVTSAADGVSASNVAGRLSFEASMHAALQTARGPTATAEMAGANRVLPVVSTQPPDFISTFQAQLQKVSDLDEQGMMLAEKYERGETTDIAQVVLAGQRGMIGFEATLQVRNKLLAAYKDIMNMPV